MQVNRRQFRIKHDGFQTRYALLCFIYNYGDSRHGNILADNNYFHATLPKDIGKILINFVYLVIFNINKGNSYLVPKNKREDTNK